MDNSGLYQSTEMEGNSRPSASSSINLFSPFSALIEVLDLALCSHCSRAELRFRKYIEEIGIDLDGSILDIACGPVSLGCIYDNVYGHDNSPKIVRYLREKGISACQADITQLDYPPKSFRYVVTFNPPMKPFCRKSDFRSGIKRFVEDMLRIAEERVIIRSGPAMSFLPSEYDHLVEKKGVSFVVYNAKQYQ